MKKLAWLLIICCTTGLYGQKVEVSKKTERIKSESAEGYRTELEASKEEVSASLTRFLKDLGKIKSGSGYQYVEGPAMGGTVYSTGIVYAQADGNEDKASAWLGIKAAEWTVNDVKLVEEQLEKLVYQFGVRFYRDKIQKQIDESQQALDAVARQQQRLVNQNRDLVIKLSNNEQEKVQLEKNIETNKLEHLVTLQRIENNKRDQDSVKMAGEQIKKVLELHKDRQRKVN